MKIWIPRFVWLVLNIVDGEISGFYGFFSFVHFLNLNNGVSQLLTQCNQPWGASHLILCLEQRGPNVETEILLLSKSNTS